MQLRTKSYIVPQQKTSQKKAQISVIKILMTNVLENKDRSKSINLGQFSLQILAFFAFNPKAKSHLPRPLEADIQEAKIIYYYPENASQYQKRNQVGMAEGFFVFCDSFCQKSQRAREGIGFQLIYIDDRTYMCISVNDQLSLFFGFKHQSLTSVRSTFISTHQKYYKNLVRHFLDHFDLWFNNDIRWVGHYFKLWLKLNSNNDQINLMKFSHRYLKYATVANQNYQSSALVIQYLHTLLRNITPRLEYTAIFHRSHYVYSNLPLNILVLLKEHYFHNDFIYRTSTTPNYSKFEPYRQAQSELNEEDVFIGQAYMRFQNLQEVVEKDELILTQQIYIKGVPYFIFMQPHNDLFVFLLFNRAPKPSSLIDISLAIKRNGDNFCDRLSYFAQRKNEQCEPHNYIYINESSLLLKNSREMCQENLSRKYMNILSEMRLQLEEGSHNTIIFRSGSFWVYGQKTCDRIMMVLLPEAIAQERLEAEIESVINHQFPGVFL